MAEWDSVFSFVLPTKIVFGPGCAARLGELLEELGHSSGLGVKKPLVITDPGLVKAGIVEKVLAALPAGTRPQVFDGVEANPKDRNVAAAAAAYRKAGADAIIALGGGSPIDCAKAAGVLIAHNACDIKLFEGKQGAVKPIPPLLAIPTTSGTGSELTFSSVITDTANHYKMTIKNAHTAAKIALCDPLLTMTVPPAVTAATGMDALTHAIEAYTAACAEPLADAAALHAIELIAANLRAAFNDGGSLEARSKMLMGSMLGGIAFSHSDVASVHCIAEALGGMYDLPHGACNAVILPHMMEYNMEYCRERYARIGEAMGIRFDRRAAITERAQITAEAVRQLALDVKLPLFAELGVKAEDFPAIAASSARNGSNPSNPRPMTEDNYRELLQLMSAAK
jgi:alcohol dehydrogenase